MESDRFDSVLDHHSTLGHTPPPLRLSYFLLTSWLLDPFIVTCVLLYWGIPPSTGY